MLALAWWPDMANWSQPQEIGLARRLEEVVAELRRCTPELLKVHVRALEEMASTARLASQPRRLDVPEPASRRDADV